MAEESSPTQGGPRSQGSRATAMPRHHFSPPGPLKTGGDLAQHWRDWRQLWDAYETVVGLRAEDDDYRIAVFIQSIGQPALKCFNALRYEAPKDKSKMDKVLQAMERYCQGKTNVIFYRCTFNNRRQEDGETFDAYLTDLVDLIRQMDKPEEELLRDIIVCAVRDDSLRQQFLSKTDRSLANCMDLCRAHEASARQVKDIAGAEKVHVVKKSKPERITTETPREPRATRCDRCGWYHGSSPEECPAYNALCLNCGKKGHYARKYRREEMPHDKQREAKSVNFRMTTTVNTVKTVKKV